MSASVKCPLCGRRLQRMARVDSDQRIEAMWRYCENLACTYDERPRPQGERSET